MSKRPPVSVVVPFHGGAAEAGRLLAALGELRLSKGDELLVADNTPRGVVPPHGVAGVVRAPERPSSYYARNVGAEAAENEWLVFLDADCVPRPRLLDVYFAPLPGATTGAVAGELAVARGQEGLLARYAESRGYLRQGRILAHPYRPSAVTANLLVRRAAWASVGGFQEGVRSSGDLDFAWRLQDAGWSLEHRPAALAEHRFPSTIRALARRFARYGAGNAWLRRRHPGFPRPRAAAGLARAAAGTAGLALTGRPRRAALKLVDGVVIAAGRAGWAMSNAADPRPAGPAECLALVDAFPALTETFLTGELQALRRAGVALRVEAGARPRRPDWPPGRGLAARWLEDDGTARKAGALAWLAARHPAGVARDLLARRRWRREEDVWPLRSLAPVAWRLTRGGEAHVHAYFAAGSALNALRLSRLLGVTYSVTAYAYEIYRRPANLAEKLAGAAFVATVSEAAAQEVRRAGAREAHVVHTGVDGERFRRRRPAPDRRAVLAVGRLVEKKGFGVLVDAAARLRDCDLRVRIAGDGPQRRALEEQVARLGLGGTVELLGAVGHDEVRELMEDADVLAMPCVIAADGDRDVLPNVVSEALAMELPVVGTDVAELPEVVRPEWGRIVRSGDPAALARALAELLDLDPAGRAAMGRAGREHVLATRDPDAGALKLAGLLRQRTSRR